MTAAPGRTYRYFTGQPLFPFGSGLSLTTFTHTASCQATDSPTNTIQCTAKVKNVGKRDGDEVV